MVSTTASQIDLLIIGAGPAGLMAAAWASRYGISCRIIEKNATRLTSGHADGLQPRTLEIFDSFGIADCPLKEGYHVIEICSWNPDKHGNLQRTQRVKSQRPGSSRFQQVSLGQSTIEQIFIDFLKTDGDSIRVERGVVPQSLQLDTTSLAGRNDYPITLRVRHNVDEPETVPTTFERTDGSSNKASTGADHATKSFVNGIKQTNDAAIETIQAKYLIGCDGARSWTRGQVGISLEGEMSDHVWGVMDIVPLTNFPDIRLSCAIHSSSNGSLMTVPRENGLVRLYIQFKEVKKDEAFDRTNNSPEDLLRTARQIIAPYTLEYRYCDWWSLYQIGQRVAPNFGIGRRIFLAGDAVHNHSPKAGQGMNVSMQDTYNLCWKICSVLNGLAKPDLLDSYEAERRQVALDLIRVDHEISRFYSVASASQSDFQAFRDKFYDFLSGVGVTYAQGYLQDSSSTQNSVASNIVVGKRLASYQVLNQADAKPTQVAEVLLSNGRWRIIIFAGDLRIPEQLSRMNKAASGIRQIVKSYTPTGQDIDSVIEVVTIHSAPRISIGLLELDEIYHPWDDTKGWDYGKVFVDDESHHQGFANAYKQYGIDREKGCFVVCRPDQHVGCKGQLQGLRRMLDDYFRDILIRHNTAKL